MFSFSQYVFVYSENPADLSVGDGLSKRLLVLLQFQLFEGINIA